jgi:hypothetical protein
MSSPPTLGRGCETFTNPGISISISISPADDTPRQSLGRQIWAVLPYQRNGASSQFNCVWIDAQLIPGTAERLCWLGFRANVRMETPRRAAHVYLTGAMHHSVCNSPGKQIMREVCGYILRSLVASTLCLPLFGGCSHRDTRCRARCRTPQPGRGRMNWTMSKFPPNLHHSSWPARNCFDLVHS